MADSDSQSKPQKDGITSEEQKNKFQFNILTEEESSEDAFEDGAHRRIADSLYAVITSQEHSANIGLSGEWGSGKSTVIRMLKEKMENDHLFFIFDSWAYENDSLRIDFLLEFIHEIKMFFDRKYENFTTSWYSKQAKIISGKKTNKTK